jgi:hypothetical protein
MVIPAGYLVLERGKEEARPAAAPPPAPAPVPVPAPVPAAEKAVGVIPGEGTPAK